MIWHLLTLSKFFSKIGNYFYSLHVTKLHSKQRKEREMAMGTHKTKSGKTAKKGLYYNINQKKKAGTSATKKKSSITPKAYANMKAGFPKKKKK